MSGDPQFCLVGQVFVDVTLPSGSHENKLRLGGVMHAARAMWALGLKYCLAYAAPAYLVPLVDDFAAKHGAERRVRIAEITGSPNVVLIPEPTEAGSQGYEVLLGESQQVQTFKDELVGLAKADFSDVMVFPGGFDLAAVLNAFSNSRARCHIDVAYDVDSFGICGELKRKFDVVMLSTSSKLFLDTYGGDPARVRDAVLGGIGNRLLFKENRGGARLYDDAGAVLETGAQLRPVEHSVGVGDCFNTAFLVLRTRFPERIALAYASFIAAEYAATTFPEDFRDAVSQTLQIRPEDVAEIEGVRLPWESRQGINVYIAAPDFDYVDRSPIIAMEKALRYHNFYPRRPVIEHGQAKEDDAPARKRQLFDQDMELLGQCQVLVAVLLDNDPGTLIEIGLAKEQGKPVIAYDPFGIARNLVLQQIPDVLALSLDEAIAGVFEHAARIRREG